MSQVIVRFPPSPTGYLHIGGARTALYNWLFARKHGGKLILRIEDTDAERSTQASIDGILEGLRWLGLNWDEGPYFQSAHLAEHVAVAHRLVATGHAYRCFCSKEELEAKREAAMAAKASLHYDGTCRRLSAVEVAAREAAGQPSVIRFKAPEGPGTVTFVDRVYGTIERSLADIEDFVIVRSNGSPLYLLSNVVDDIRDGITHVIRGQDGLANTPRQILIYQALGAPLPEFAHMPLTLDPAKAKISKRTHGEVVTVQFYREHGFLPWGLANFLVLLGWATADSREIFTLPELLAAFSLEGISRHNAVFNYRKGDPKFFTDPKALSINAHHLRAMPVAELVPLVRPHLEAAGLWDPAFAGSRQDWLFATIELLRPRFHTLCDFATLGRPYFVDDYPFQEEAVARNIAKHPGLVDWLPALAERLAALAVFDAAAAEATLRGLADELGVKAGILINATRTMVTGGAVGPSLFEVLAILGQERAVARLRRPLPAAGA
ncbi:MAG: glutamate--tRNA ligase [Thermodesulfobacteriota bacterium]